MISTHHIYLETHINMLRSQTSTPSFAWKDTLGATSSRWHLVWSFEHVQRRPSTRNGHGQSGSPIGCEGLYFHAMYKNSVSVVKVFAEI